MTTTDFHRPSVLRRVNALLDHIRFVLDQDADIPLNTGDIRELIEDVFISYPPAEYLFAVATAEDPQLDLSRVNGDNLLIFMGPLAVEAALLRRGVSVRELVRRLENIEAYAANLKVRLDT